MTAEEVAKLCLSRFCLVKREKCQDEKGPADLAPMIELKWVDGENALAIVPDRDVIPIAVEQLKKERPGVEVEFVAFMSDSYVRMFEGADAEANKDKKFEREELSSAFAEGDMRVREAISVNVTVPGEAPAYAHSVYTYDDEGLPHFDEPKSVTADENRVVGGAVASRMEEAMGESTERQPEHRPES